MPIEGRGSGRRKEGAEGGRRGKEDENGGKSLLIMIVNAVRHCVIREEFVRGVSGGDQQHRTAHILASKTS